MKTLKLEIGLLEGLDELKFGDSPETVKNVLGEPVEVEDIGEEVGVSL